MSRFRTLRFRRGATGQVVTWDAPAPIADGADVTFVVRKPAEDISAAMSRPPAGTVVALDTARRRLTVEVDIDDDPFTVGPAYVDSEAVTVWRVDVAGGDGAPAGKRRDLVDLAAPMPRPPATGARIEPGRWVGTVPDAAVAADGTFAWLVDWPGAPRPAPGSGIMRVALRPFTTGLGVQKVEDLVPGVDTVRARRPDAVEVQIEATETELLQKLRHRGIDPSAGNGAAFEVCHAFMVATNLATNGDDAERHRSNADRLFELALAGAWNDTTGDGVVNDGEVGRVTGSASILSVDYAEARHRRDDW